MLKPLLLVSALLLMSTGTAFTLPRMAQEAAAPTPPDTKNPVKSTPETEAKAKKVYGYECEMCHGATGDGKTDLATSMKLTLTDLSDPKTLADKTDAQLFDIIKNGKGQMTGEAGRMKTDDMWSLVTYLRGLAKK